MPNINVYYVDIERNLSTQPDMKTIPGSQSWARKRGIKIDWKLLPPAKPPEVLLIMPPQRPQNHLVLSFPRPAFLLFSPIL